VLVLVRGPRDLSELLYEDHPDDLEWVVRAGEHFAVFGGF